MRCEDRMSAYGWGTSMDMRSTGRLSASRGLGEPDQLYIGYVHIWEETIWVYPTCDEATTRRRRIHNQAVR